MKNLLLSQGYNVDPKLTPRRETAYESFNREYRFWHQDRLAFIEIQWGLTAAYYSVALDYEAFWERLSVVQLAGRGFPGLSSEDLLLVLCIHGFQHIWERLEWISGVAEVIRNCPHLDWRAVFEEARRIGCERILLLGVFLASQLLEAPLPEAVDRKLVRDRVVPRLAEEVKERLFSEHRDFGGERLRGFHLRARERLRDRVWCCYHQLATPYIPDWSLVDLPAPLFPLYYLLRPLRLAGKQAARLKRKLIVTPRT